MAQENRGITEGNEGHGAKVGKDDRGWSIVKLSKFDSLEVCLNCNATTGQKKAIAG